MGMIIWGLFDNIFGFGSWFFVFSLNLYVICLVQRLITVGYCSTFMIKVVTNNKF